MSSFSRKLVVGLGNPGKQYEHTRHNIGFLILDRYLEVQLGHDSKFRKRFESLVTEAPVQGCPVVFLKPQTFMNNSGMSVQQCCHFYAIDPEQIIVLHDEVDLPFATAKIKLGGGFAGHKGLISIGKTIATDCFIRIRAGIGRNEIIDTSSHVLGQFNQEERTYLPGFLAIVGEMLDTLLKTDNIDACMNRYNGKVNRESF